MKHIDIIIAAPKLAAIGIKLAPNCHSTIIRSTPQAVCVNKLKAAGYEEVQWSQKQWNEYYDHCSTFKVHSVMAGMKANIMAKGNEIIIVGRNMNGQWIIHNITL